MALWQAKNTGILFGGVTDEDTNEETLESVFHNDLYVYRRLPLAHVSTSARYGYQIAGNGRWVSMALKRPKQKGGAKKKKAKTAAVPVKTSAPVLEDRDGEPDEERYDEYNSDEVRVWL